MFSRIDIYALHNQYITPQRGHCNRRWL